jgi:hypothetical protein
VRGKSIEIVRGVQHRGVVAHRDLVDQPREPDGEQLVAAVIFLLVSRDLA